MQKIKFDRARKELKIDGDKIKSQTLEYFIQKNTFDKHHSTFLNHKGLTYILDNPISEEDEEIFNPITLQYQDTDLQERLFAMKPQSEIDAINEIKKEYGY